MNLLLFDERDLAPPQREALEVVIRDRHRLEHLRKTLRSRVGDRLTVGRLGGRIGQGTLVALDSRSARLEVRLEREPPAPLPCEVVLALPRPPMLRRILQSVVTLGVKELVLLNSARVEKSFWQSSVLAPASIERQLRLGLEQAVDTVLPVVTLEQRFRPFVEDRLRSRLERGPIVVADPTFPSRPSVGLSIAPGQGRVTLVIGPEGGFVPFELALLEDIGASGVALGERIQRVETAVVSLLSLAKAELGHR